MTLGRVLEWQEERGCSLSLNLILVTFAARLKVEIFLREVSFVETCAAVHQKLEPESRQGMPLLVWTDLYRLGFASNFTWPDAEDGIARF